MMLVIGSERRLHSKMGFTLIEILLALAILTLGATVTVLGIGGILTRDESRSIDSVLKEAITEARFEALNSGQRATLLFDPSRTALVISVGSSELAAYLLGPSGEAKPDRSVNVQFYRMHTPSETSGFAPQQMRSDPLTAIYFDPDRSSTPFFVEIQGDGQAQRRIAFDPFSNLPMRPLESNFEI